MESLEVILKAWTQDPFTHKGEFYEFPVPGWKETNRFLMPLEKEYHSEDGEYTGCISIQGLIKILIPQYG